MMDAGITQRHAVRGLQLNVRRWTNPQASNAGTPSLLMVHGWMDCSASFAFLVDALGQQGSPYASMLACDLRGFGQSDWSGNGVYGYYDYLADIDALVDSLVARGELTLPFDLLGHSLGGNIVMLYAAARPQRVRRLINMEGFGLRAYPASHAPAHYTQWLDQAVKTGQRRVYPDMDGIVERVRELSSRISEERLRFVAEHWSEQVEGGWQLRADPGHRRPSPDLYREDELRACWSSLAMPVLWLQADHTENIARHGLTLESLAERRAVIPHVSVAPIVDAGHMLHWDQPQQVASAIQTFALA